MIAISRFHYNAGFASREEDPAAPGVMAAADDPPEVFLRISKAFKINVSFLEFSTYLHI